MSQPPTDARGVEEPEETYDHHDLVCPYCRHRLGDSYEYFEGGREDIDEIECHECDRSFSASRQISYMYIARPLKEHP